MLGNASRMMILDKHWHGEPGNASVFGEGTGAPKTLGQVSVSPAFIGAVGPASQDGKHFAGAKFIQELF